jgi:RNA polymerase sigma-70 factor (ECF subfamily)
MRVAHAETAAAGGLAAFYDVHRPELLRFLTARCGDASEAEDTLQELWLKLHAIPAGPIANGRGYLFRMANNLVMDRRRARLRAMARDRAWLGSDAPPEARPDPAIAADQEIAEEQERAILRKAITALPPGAQRALRLYRFDGLDQGAIAQVMGISRSGVEKHLALAMRHLRTALADCGLFDAAASYDGDRPDQGAGR